MIKNEERHKAILELRPEGGFSLNDEGEVTFNAEGLNEPSESEIKTVMDRMQAEYDVQAYARNRRSEYPSNGDQWDMIYKDMKNSTTTHKDAVEIVKTKWPKDNSGPV